MNRRGRATKLPPANFGQYPNGTLAALEQRRVVLNNKGMPTGEIETKSILGTKRQTIGNYTRTQQFMKNYKKREEEKKKFNQRGMFNMYNIMTPEIPSSPASYNPVSPNYAKNINKKNIPNSPSYSNIYKIPNNAPIQNKLGVANTCMPNDFLYREFRTGKNSYFNFIMSNNKNGFSNIKVPNKNGPIQPGISFVGKGNEGAVFVGCIDNKCKEKVAIKAGPALKSTENSKFKRNYKTSPTVVEFKMNMDIVKKCIDQTPHIVVPYSLAICQPEKAFIKLTNNKLKHAVYEQFAGGLTKAVKDSERIVVAYYEFFNGGDLFTWMARHSNTITEKDFKVILFQLIWTLDVMYKKVPSFRHNDLHLQNIFVKTDNIPTDGHTVYGDKFKVPNRKVVTAIGDFGWAHSKNRPNPKILSGMWKQFGHTPNKTVRQDLHFLIHSLLISVPKKFEKARAFLMSALSNAPNLTMRNSELIKQNRLLKNNQRVATTGQLLDSDYFKEFRMDYEKPKPIPAPRPKNNKRSEKNIVRNIKKMVNEPRTCGKRKSSKYPKNSDVRGMDVEDMIKFIARKGTDGAKMLLANEKKKPTRSRACEILMTFREGKKLFGMVSSPSPPPAPVVNNANNNNNNNNGMRASQMTKNELVNFISNQGTNNAVLELNSLGNNPRRTDLMKIMRSFVKGKAKIMGPRVMAPVMPKARQPTMLVIPKSRGYNATARVTPNRTRVAIGKPKYSKLELLVIQRVTNRLYNKMNRSGNTNLNALRAVARNKAERNYNALKNAGLINNTNLRNVTKLVNNMAPPVKKAMPAANAAAVRMAAIRRKGPVSPGIRNMPAKLNSYTYEMNGTPTSANNLVNKFYIKGRKATGYTRAELNTVLKRVGVKPNTIASKKDAILAIAKKRMSRVKPYRTQKQKNANAEKVYLNAKAEYNARLAAQNKLREEMAKKRRNMAKAKEEENRRLTVKNQRGVVMGKIVPRKPGNKKYTLSDLLKMAAAK